MSLAPVEHGYARSGIEISARPNDRAAIFAGLLVAALFLGGFGGWAALAPLSSAAIAPGQVRVESHSKTVQHMEGGIIREILVHEGDWVEKGQVLLRLDATQADAAFGMLRSQFDALRSLEARLVAERDNLAKINFPPELADECVVPANRAVCSGQEKIFADRKQLREGQVEILRRRIDQLRSEIDGRRAQVASLETQISMTNAEAKGVEPLVAQQLLPKPRLLALQRQVASLDGNRGEQLALISKAEQGIGEAQMEITEVANKFQAEVAGELRDTQEKLANLSERLRAAADVRNRTLVVAPQSGKIVNLRYFTLGGVIKAGDPILDIVPQDEKLIIHSEVRPLDIEAVHPGLSAQVLLTAYNQRRVPSVDGRVTYVSADRLLDNRSGQPYYAADVEIDPGALERLQEVKLYPGMPAEVLIRTGERTLLQYLLDPIRDSFARAFREK